MSANPNVSPEAPLARFQFASRRTARAPGAATLLAVLAQVLLSVFGGRGGGGIWVALLPFGALGAVVARRQPRNPIGVILILLTLSIVVSSDAGRYALLRYRHGDHALPFARVAVFLAPGTWMWLVVFLPLPIALFPDGRLSRGWHQVFRAYLVVCAAFVSVNAWQNVGAFTARHIRVDSKGLLISNTSSASDIAYKAVLYLYLVFGVAWIARVVMSYRSSTGAYRQQLKWLLSGGTLSIIGLGLAFASSGTSSTILNAAGNIGLGVSLVAIPIALAIGILKYRLYDIDRLISRTLSYTIVTGLLVAVFVGIVGLTTRVFAFSSPAGVAASTLAAAALFNPLRLRVQRLVDRRFNRARYDAEAIVGTFTLRLRDAVDLDTVRSELLAAVEGAVQPSYASVWIRPPATRIGAPSSTRR